MCLELAHVATKTADVLAGEALLKQALVEALDLLDTVVVALEDCALITEAALLGAGTADLTVGDLGGGSSTSGINDR